MDKPAILVVDDEEKILELVRLYLEKNGFKVFTANNGEEALKKVKEISPKLIILDIMLPKIDGLKVCQEIRKNYSIPIILLTAKGEEIDRVLGLEMGADDYVCKPFSPRELVARVKAILRRLDSSVSDSKSLSYDGLNIDYDFRKVTVGGKEIKLSPKEFELLWFLAKNPGRVYSREQLLENVWGYVYLGDPRTVDTHVKRLRMKLEKDGNQFIKTVWGVGYKFEVDK
ncbi:MAG: two-component system, OmpR family, response regulator ResD [Thermosediminibacterales bacterium]|nr:two-component system, OmpR family, response regulator ResD [Thermosediminibacterales bacterium]MDK2836180.1 two-component system, OmpR family, response regulator ResD [Thermosediminibacterales bacterium]